MTNQRICVTGATGNVGLETLRELYSLTRNGTNTQLIAAVPSPDRARQTIALENVEYRALDMMKPDKARFEEALEGVERLFLLRPPQISDVKRCIAPLVQAAKEVGVRHIVFLSLFGVEERKQTPHYAIEELIRASGIEWTFLRPSFFMQNLSTTHREEIATRGEIVVPAGNGATNFVDAKDIGKVAASVLASPQAHLNTAYNLTGKLSYTYQEIASILSRELGRSITYKQPSKLTFFFRKVFRERLPVSFVLVMIYLYHQTIIGKANGYSPDLERLLGNTPISFEEFAHRERQTWIQ